MYYLYIYILIVLLCFGMKFKKKSFFTLRLRGVQKLTYGSPATCIFSSHSSNSSTASTYSSLMACNNESLTLIPYLSNICIRSMFSFSMAVINADLFNGSVQSMLRISVWSLCSSSSLYEIYGFVITVLQLYEFNKQNYIL